MVADVEPLLVEQSCGAFKREMITGWHVCPHPSCNTDDAGMATRCESEPVLGLLCTRKVHIRQY